MSIKTAINSVSVAPQPQCEHFVVRKKRLCRMTVRTGARYCGEHLPQPQASALGQDDTRIPCPNDPKHTCYVSRLERHLLVCNARAGAEPAYIERDVNAAGVGAAPCPGGARTPLALVSREALVRVIHKVNALYEEQIEGNISTLAERPIHGHVFGEFSDGARGESSRRHLRQASALLLAAEEHRLVQDRTCYVELGAGRGQLAYYMYTAWCYPESLSRVLLVDRAPPRHKRDNKLRAPASAPGAPPPSPSATRLRADLAHLALHRVPAVQESDAVVGFAKHLCGVATDYALRCLTAPGVRHKTTGVVMATCCHHRCELQPYFGAPHLQELGITAEDFNVMLGIVSWATCGDGRSRDRRGRDRDSRDASRDEHQSTDGVFVSEDQGSENTSSKDQSNERISGSKDQSNECTSESKDQSSDKSGLRDQSGINTSDSGQNSECMSVEQRSEIMSNVTRESSRDLSSGGEQSVNRGSASVTQCPALSPEARAEAGRRAKAVLDWGRVLALRALGLHARLTRFVPAAVSPENLCILATRDSLDDQHTDNITSITKCPDSSTDT